MDTDFRDQVASGLSGRDLLHAPVTDRVNAEPAVINGMSTTEAKYIAIASELAFLVIGGVLFALTGFWHFLFAFAVFGPLLALWFGSLYLQALKRNKPDGHYAQALHLWMVQRSLAKPHYLLHEGHWDLGRSLGLDLSSPLEPPPAAKRPTTSSPSPAKEALAS